MADAKWPSGKDGRQVLTGTSEDVSRVLGRAPLVTATVLVAAAVGALVAWAGDERLLYGLAALATIGCFLFWRAGLYVVFILLFVEGYLRNRFGAPQILLFKDVLLAAIYLRVFGERLLTGERLIPRTLLEVPLAVFALVVVVQTINPYVVSPVEALVGLRTWLWYVPLFYVGALAVRKDADRRKFLLFLLCSALLIGSIAVAQYIAGPAAYSSQGAAFKDATFVTAGTGGTLVFRPNATFSFSSHFAIFLALSTLVATGVALRAGGKWRVIAALLLAFLVAVNLIEAQRTFYVLLPPLILLIAWQRRSVRSAVGLATAAVVAIVLVGLTANLASSSLGVFDRPLALFTGDLSVFLVRAQTDLSSIIGLIQKSAFGEGTGATSIGSRYVLGFIPTFVEFSLAKVIGDLGLVGLFPYVWMIAALILDTAKTVRWAQANGKQVLAIDAMAVLASQILIAYTGYDLAVAALLFWFMSGMVIGARMVQAESLSRLARQTDLTTPMDANSSSRTGSLARL